MTLKSWFNDLKVQVMLALTVGMNQGLEWRERALKKKEPRVMFDGKDLLVSTEEGDVGAD